MVLAVFLVRHEFGLFSSGSAHSLSLFYSTGCSKNWKWSSADQADWPTVQAMITKENNFKQPGERFRSFDPARYLFTRDALMRTEIMLTLESWCSWWDRSGRWNGLSFLSSRFFLALEPGHWARVCIAGRRGLLDAFQTCCLTRGWQTKSAKHGYHTGSRYVESLPILRVFASNDRVVKNHWDESVLWT